MSAYASASVSFQAATGANLSITGIVPLSSRSDISGLAGVALKAPGLAALLRAEGACAGVPSSASLRDEGGTSQTLPLVFLAVVTLGAV